MNITLFIFLMVYLATGLGKLPGFKVDRTGAAMIGAMAMMAVGSIGAKAAWVAVDYRTIGMLFGLMVVSGAFAESGFYEWTARKVATLSVGPIALLAVFVAVSGCLSALLTNDVVVVAMTPLLVSVTLARGLNPVPFLLAFCFAANTGSAGTLIGSPQNMIAAQELGISFTGFLSVAGIPALLSLPIVWGIVAWMYRGKWTLEHAGVSKERTGTKTEQTPLNIQETCKAIFITISVIIAFVLDVWPKELVALTAAAILLLNRKISSSDVLRRVDANLLLLISGLFIVNAALSKTGLPQNILHHLHGYGIDLNDPLSLFLTSATLSNIIGNNPTVMLLVPFLNSGANVNAVGAALALGTGFFSNLIIFGSLAGIIVVEQSARCGVKISFATFTRVGAPISAACMLMAAGWIIFLTSHQSY
ncbi:transporter [Gluconobacter sp. DsW_056]|uniref:SLC13 family permease n=1 Tax=Gluconobacter sp. DsW_056 TaxID=1511209 RepID=UPI000A3C1C46|nr:SLC13 family permease [Gluconobacter sp. DsW_056]OUI84300.1 transporter [Gluconobacter sp. DsW_056]